MPIRSSHLGGADDVTTEFATVRGVVRLDLLEQVARGAGSATVDAELPQEILHRYRAIGRWGDGCLVFDLVRQLFPSVVPVTSRVVDVARRLLDEDSALLARDALHTAVVITEGLEATCRYDPDFDRVSRIVRKTPDQLLTLP